MMTLIQIIGMLLGTFIVLSLVAVLVRVIFCRKPTDKPIASREEWVDIEPTIVKLHAKVVDQRCFVAWVGIKMPKAVKHFAVTFQDDNGQTHEIEVAEDMYDGFEVGQMGVLTLIDGKVESYTLDA